MIEEIYKDRKKLRVEIERERETERERESTPTLIYCQCWVSLEPERAGCRGPEDNVIRELPYIP